MPTPQRPASPWLSLGRGGWSLHFPTVRSSANSSSRSTLSHYGDTWRTHLDEMTADVIGTDSTVIADAHEIATFAVAGPMGDPDVPAGMINSFSNGLIAWRDEPEPNRDARFGNAHSLDCVALDVYVTILRRFGGRVFNPRAEAETLAAA